MKCRRLMAAVAVCKIPAGSQSGRQMRLRCKGMPALRGGAAGDMFIELGRGNPCEPDQHVKKNCSRSLKTLAGEQP